MLDLGYMHVHVFMNVLKNGTPMDLHQSSFFINTLNNIDMTMNIITHT